MHSTITNYAWFDDFWCMKQNGCDFTRLLLLRAVYLLSFNQQLMLPPGLELARPLRSWTTSLRTSACVSCDCCKGRGPFRLKVWENKYDIITWLILGCKTIPQVFLLRMAMIGWAREPLDIQCVRPFAKQPTRLALSVVDPLPPDVWELGNWDSCVNSCLHWLARYYNTHQHTQFWYEYESWSQYNMRNAGPVLRCYEPIIW